MWDSSHIHTHHTINQIGVSQSPPLKSLTSSLGPTLCGSVPESTGSYQVGSNTICNDLRKSANHICTNYTCAIPQKDQSQLRLLVIVNKASDLPSKYPMWDSSHIDIHHTINQIGVSQQFNLANTYETHHTPTHITQSIKLGITISPT